MVCYWSISARLPYTFLLPFVLRPATFVHAEDVGWYTRGERSDGRKKSTAVPRRNSAYPAHRTDSRSFKRKKNTLLPPVFLFFYFFFIKNLTKSFCKREKKGEEPLWNISWSQSSKRKINASFYDWSQLLLIKQILLYPNIYNYFFINDWLT